MLFVDGENLTIRAQAMAQNRGLRLEEGEYYRRDRFIWMPGVNARERMFGKELDDHALRASYYTSLVGDESALTDTRQSLWDLGFDPQVFKKNRPELKAKGVDIAITKDMLAHAFRQNYEIAVLIAGDGDYVPLVEEVKRLGKRVHVRFFESDGLHPDLKRASDRFVDLTEQFIKQWQWATGTQPKP